MIRVIVIDDEPVIARSIKNSIEMCDPEFQVIAVANDGQSGLMLIREKQPDLLFVDICMPVLGGLELLQKLKDEGGEIPAVILSGYQEFEYAKRSITLGVLDYLVKPLNPLTLKAFLDKLKTMLIAKIYERQCRLIEKFFHSSEEVSSDLLGFPLNCNFFIVKIVLNAFNFVRNNQFGLPSVLIDETSIHSMCERYYARFSYWLVKGRYENEYILLLMENVNTKQKIRQMYEEMKEQLAPRHYTSFVINAEPRPFDALKETLMKLEILLYYGSIYGVSCLLTDDVSYNGQKHMETGKIALDSGHMKKLIQQKKRDAIIELIRQTLYACKKTQCTQARLIEILRKIMKNCCLDEPEFEIDFMINLMLVNSSDYETLCKKVCEALQEYIKTEKNQEAVSSEYVIYRIQDYLDEHFREKIVIQEIADQFGLNYSYMCSLFRKYKHVSPNEYLILKKIEQAKLLLATREDLNIKDVAELVGYTDQYYFSRLFKTYVKISPKEYRKREMIK